VQTGNSADVFAAYFTYREELAAALARIATGVDPATVGAVAHLDGLAYQRLRQNIPVDVRRVYSTFFTSSALRTRLVASYRGPISAGATVLDPACGAGDLLLAAAELLPRTWTAARLQRHIATRFHGRDLVEVLAQITRDRLRLAMALAAPQGRGSGLVVTRTRHHRRSPSPTSPTYLSAMWYPIGTPRLACQYRTFPFTLFL
jgi:hypothetical protein